MAYKPKELTKIHKDLSKKGIKTSEEILKDWLEKSVDIETTDSVKEHDLINW